MESKFYGSYETMDIGPVAPFEEGYNAGSNGKHYSQSPNVYLPGGSKYDGVDSMGPAAAWYEGWARARRHYGRSIADYCLGPAACKRVSPTNDGLDYLENERG